MPLGPIIHAFALRNFHAQMDFPSFPGILPFLNSISPERESADSRWLQRTRVANFLSIQCHLRCPRRSLGSSSSVRVSTNLLPQFLAPCCPGLILTPSSRTSLSRSLTDLAGKNVLSREDKFLSVFPTSIDFC